MQLEVRSNLTRQLDDTVILHDQRVGSSLGNGGDRTGGLGELVFEYESVEGEVATHAAAVQGFHHQRQLGQ